MFICTSTHVKIYVCTYTSLLYVCIHAHIHMYAYLCIDTHTRVDATMCTYIFKRLHVHTYLYISTLPCLAFTCVCVHVDCRNRVIDPLLSPNLLSSLSLPHLYDICKFPCRVPHRRPHPTTPCERTRRMHCTDVMRAVIGSLMGECKHRYLSHLHPWRPHIAKDPDLGVCQILVPTHTFSMVCAGRLRGQARTTGSKDTTTQTSSLKSNVGTLIVERTNLPQPCPRMKGCISSAVHAALPHLLPCRTQYS